HVVTIKRASETNLTEFNNYDLIILSTPSWLERKDEGQPHENFLKLMDTATENTSFSGKKFALFGLGDETYAHFGRGIDRVGIFVTEHGGEIIAPILKMDGYLFSPKQSEEKLLSWLESLPL
ncbi:MAG TPA: flavodoxin domain-containing protein, partial [Candidatus Woesebacteria bacterium]|nr:flavodoxin domain-containing protein [Candidatus Woesebacteria bacterium]